MTSTVSVQPAKFVDQPGMAQVHKDSRHIITERVTYVAAGMCRITRIKVKGKVSLGNRYHGFTVLFAGMGGGVLYTAPAYNPTNIAWHVLPEDGWKVTIPAGTVHTFVLSSGAVLTSFTDRFFVYENQHEHPGCKVNTHSVWLGV